MKPIYYADQMITAYEIAMGLPEAINPDRKTCSVRGTFFTMEDVPLRYVLGRYDRDVSEEHYGFQNVRPLLGEHTELAERYLREVEAKWNASYEHSAVTPEVSPGPVLGGLGT